MHRQGRACARGGWCIFVAPVCQDRHPSTAAPFPGRGGVSPGIMFFVLSFPPWIALWDQWHSGMVWHGTAENTAVTQTCSGCAALLEPCDWLSHLCRRFGEFAFMYGALPVAISPFVFSEEYNAFPIIVAGAVPCATQHAGLLHRLADPCSDFCDGVLCLFLRGSCCFNAHIGPGDVHHDSILRQQMCIQ